MQFFNMHGFRCALGLLASLFAVAQTQAMPLFPPEIIPASRPIYFFNGGTFSYDSTTDLFSSVAAEQFFSGFTSADERIDGGPGQLTFNTTVDSAGQVTQSAGSANWTGSIPDLGIPNGTLLSATITHISVFDLGLFNGSGIVDPVLQILMDVDSANPALDFGFTLGFQHLVPGVNLPAGRTLAEFLADPFGSSFTLGTTSFGDLINIPPTKVPAPGTLALFGMNLLLLWAWRRRRNGIR